jgi:hypothetical protein
MDATSNWNSHAASKSFKPCTASTQSQTFGQVYEGSKFAADFDAILKTIAGELLTQVPAYTSGDILGISLTNWPG